MMKIFKKTLGSMLTKGTAVFVCAAFVTTSVHLPQAFAESSLATATGYRSLTDDMTAIALPPEIGRIQETYRGTSDKIVVLIQDAHSVPDAQRSIRSVIDHFQTQYGISLVGLEGASEALDPQIFRSFPDKELLRKTLEAYAGRGELTGGTAASLFNASPSVYHGIEDWPLYEEGVTHFLKAIGMEQKIDALLDPMVAALNREKEVVYSKELLEVDRSLASFNANKTDLMQVLTQLNKYRRPPKASALALLLEEVQSEQTTDAPIEIEIKHIAEQVLSVLKGQSPTPEMRQELQEFHGNWQEFQIAGLTPQAFALYLKGLVQKYRIRVQVSRQLASLVENQKRLKDIEGTRLFEEFKRYADAVQESLFQNDRQRWLHSQVRGLALIKRLIRLELSFDDWGRVQKQISQLDQWTVAQDGVVNRHEVLALLKKMEPHLAFYRVSEQRNQVFFKNIRSMMEKQGKSSALLVAGGFHTEGLTQTFKEKGISFVLVTPRIGAVPEDPLYREHMQGKVSWSDYFEVKNGKIRLYDAFVRATRDRLLLGSPEEGRSSSPRFKKAINPQLVKEWRDQIIRDLADEDRITQASEYTRFIDETIEPLSPHERFLREKWLANINRFGEGLKKLQAEGKLSEASILQLLKTVTTAEPVLMPLANREINAALLGLVSRPSPSAGSQDMRRSETRSEDEERAPVHVGQALSREEVVARLVQFYKEHKGVEMMFPSVFGIYEEADLDALERVWNAIDLRPGQSVFDLGFGDARVLVSAALRGTRAQGMEGSWPIFNQAVKRTDLVLEKFPGVHFKKEIIGKLDLRRPQHVRWIRTDGKPGSIDLVRGDFNTYDTDFTGADVIFRHDNVGGIEPSSLIGRKLMQQMKSGALLVQIQVAGAQAGFPSRFTRVPLKPSLPGVLVYRVSPQAVDIEGRDQRSEMRDAKRNTSKVRGLAQHIHISTSTRHPHGQSTAVVPEEESRKLEAEVIGWIERIRAEKPFIIVGWLRKLGFVVTEEDEYDLEISYYDSGRYKHVFRTEITDRAKVSPPKEALIAIKTRTREDIPLFEEGEHELLQELQGTEYVPFFIDTVYIKNDVTGPSAIQKQTPVDGHQYHTLMLEEFIEGRTIAQILREKNTEEIPYLSQAMQLMLNIFFTLNNGKLNAQGDPLPGATLVGPSDFHLKNIVVMNEATRQMKMVDAGKRFYYASLADYMISVMYFFGQSGKGRLILSDAIKRFPQYKWDIVLNEVLQLVLTKRRELKNFREAQGQEAMKRRTDLIASFAIPQFNAPLEATGDPDQFINACIRDLNRVARNITSFLSRERGSSAADGAKYLKALDLNDLPEGEKRSETRSSGPQEQVANRPERVSHQETGAINEGDVFETVGTGTQRTIQVIDQKAGTARVERIDAGGNKKIEKLKLSEIERAIDRGGIRKVSAGVNEEPVAHNQRVLASDQVEEMLSVESIGGPGAGPGHLGLNLAVDASGRIVAVGNSQDLPYDVQEKMKRGIYHHVTLLVAMFNTPILGLIEMEGSLGVDRLDAVAQRNIKEAVRRHNEELGASKKRLESAIKEAKRQLANGTTLKNIKISQLVRDFELTEEQGEMLTHALHPVQRIGNAEEHTAQSSYYFSVWNWEITHPIIIKSIKMVRDAVHWFFEKLQNLLKWRWLGDSHSNWINRDQSSAATQTKSVKSQGMYLPQRVMAVVPRRSEQRQEVRPEPWTVSQATAAALANVLNPEGGGLLERAQAREIEVYVVQGKLDALIVASKKVMEGQLARIKTLPAGAIVRVSDEMTLGMVKQVLRALEINGIKRNLTMGFDVSLDGNFLRAFQTMQGDIGTAVFTKEEVRKLNRAVLAKVPVQTVGSFSNYTSHAAENHEAIPILSQNLRADYFRNKTLFGVGLDVGDIQGEPFLEVAENVVRIAVGLLKADLMTKGANPDEINAKLLKILFNLDMGSSHGVLSMNGRHLVVHREALQQIMLEYQARAATQKAA